MFKSVLTLAGWQIAQYVIPLITLPYLARILGVAAFGELAIATSLVAYVMVVTDWGFALTATQQIARHRDDPAVLRTVFWDTVVAKLCLSIPATVAGSILIYAIPTLRPAIWIYIVLSLQVYASALTANWFLQGVENMVGFTVASLVGRGAVIPLIFLLVKGPSDVVSVAALQSLGAVVSALISLWLVARFVNLTPIVFSARSVHAQLSHGWHLFLSQAAATMYSQTNVVVIGMICGNFQAGLYGGADRLRRAAQGALAPISTALYPRVSNLVGKDRKLALQVARHGFSIQILLAAGLCVALFLGAPMLVRLFLGTQFAGAVPLFDALAPLPLLVSISNATAVQIMIPFGYNREVSRIVLVSGVVNIIFLIPLGIKFGSMGAVFALLIAESLVAILSTAFVVQKFGLGVLPFSGRGVELHFEK